MWVALKAAHSVDLLVVEWVGLKGVLLVAMWVERKASMTAARLGVVMDCGSAGL